MNLDLSAVSQQSREIRELFPGCQKWGTELMSCQCQTENRIGLNERSKPAQLKSLQSKVTEGKGEVRLDPIQCYCYFFFKMIEI